MREIAPGETVVFFKTHAAVPVFHLQAYHWESATEREQVGPDQTSDHWTPFVPVAHHRTWGLTICGIETIRISWSEREDTSTTGTFNHHKNDWIEARLPYRHATQFGRLCRRCAGML